jgi:hypothetical protein
MTIKLSNGEDEKEKLQSESPIDTMGKRNDEQNHQWKQWKRARTIKLTNREDEKEKVRSESRMER